MSARLEFTVGESDIYGCTRSIYAGRDKNIISGHQVILDPSGKKPPQIGPDPSRIEKLTQMQPPTTIKEVRSFLGLVNQLSKYGNDYLMITTKIRSLLYKGVKFCWIEDHQTEFNKVIAPFSTFISLNPITMTMTCLPFFMLVLLD